MKSIIVLGGGAAGMAAAITSAQTAAGRANVILLEKNPRVGKKLLATGNGRCNLDHSPVEAKDFFTSDYLRLEEMLTAMRRHDPLKWFEDHGLLCRSDEMGRIYPYSNQASDVLNLLLYWMEISGVEVRTQCAVSGLTREEDGYRVEMESGETLAADRVICALGGSAAPQFGSDGTGISLVRPFGCKSTKLYPCLVPLKCEKQQIEGLSGIRVKGDALLCDGETPLYRESGEIQFTEYGLSGIAVMQLSGYLGQLRKVKRPVIRLDLFPEWEEGELAQWLVERGRKLPEANMGQFMTGLLHKRVGMAVWKRIELGSESRKVRSMSVGEWERLAHGFKHWCFTSPEDTGWKNAQTTGGGVQLSRLEADSFQVSGHPGLYVVGETTDCAGSCGGFNLHWAFGSGILAGLHAASGV